MSKAATAIAPYAHLISRPFSDVARDLESFAALLSKWQMAQNLVSRETEDIWSRHIADSLQLLKYIHPGDRSFVDFGSGGGFPAIPLAIALKQRAPSWVLVESSGKKSAFLRAASRELGLGLIIESTRIERADPRETHVVTSRALAHLDDLLRYSEPWFSEKTRALFHKGSTYRQELDKSAELWHFDLVVHESDTDDSAAILDISRLRRRVP